MSGFAVSRVLCTLAAFIKLADVCGKRRLVRGVAAESEVDVAIGGWAVWSLSVAPDCGMEVFLVQGQAGGGVLLLGERIVVRCEGEVMTVVAGLGVRV